jgi:hypothetical protein
MKVLKRRRKRVHGQSASQLIYVLGAMLLLVIAQISVSMKLLDKLTSNDESLLSNNQFIHTTTSFKDQIQRNNDHHQHMVILAGPHKTGNYYYFNVDTTCTFDYFQSSQSRTHHLTKIIM